MREDRIQEYIDYLIEEGYLISEEGKYPVLHLTDQAGDVLFRGKKVLFRARAAEQPSRKGKAAPPLPEDIAQEPEDGLIAALKAVRRRLAEEENVPLYIIFSNATLASMAALRPLDMEEFLRVSGVGRVKAERYGQTFLQAIQDWRAGVGG